MSERTSERRERRSEQTSEWPSTYVSILVILFVSDHSAPVQHTVSDMSTLTKDQDPPGVLPFLDFFIGNNESLFRVDFGQAGDDTVAEIGRVKSVLDQKTLVLGFDFT